ncbi:MAG: DEAD/DEAH box helicase [Anaerolineae bacterium]|nr:DEAD/DEAH box helicase [Anaerolineae bacterium]
MSLDILVESLRDDPKFMRNVTTWRTLPPYSAGTSPWPADLDPRLIRTAQSLGIETLYTHQAQAVTAALRGENVVLATGTASGKTLGYILPLLHTLLRNPQTTALLLFPTKALAHDQIVALEQWLEVLQVPIALRPYDGDTPTRHRAAIRKEARIIVSNPDMLHLGILPHHTRWARFLGGLRYVVLDELHTYRGVFGSHIANVLRRLRRITQFYGADPQLVSASATIANPQELAATLWESPVKPVAEDCAPYGQRHIVFYNPPLIDAALGRRRSAVAEAIVLARHMLQAGVQAILFARSRLTVELLLRDLRKQAIADGFDPDVIQGYRGGYLPRERRAIELQLRTGAARIVVATNALELGIDIGALDAVVLVGYPGSVASTRQQMGRAGRRVGAALAVLIATPAPLDQYMVAHPDYFFGRSSEMARVNPDTLGILSSHLACAAFELPFTYNEPFGKAAQITEILDVLASEAVLYKSNERVTWVGDVYPAQSVSLRTATADNVVIQVFPGQGQTVAQVIGVVDRPSAASLVHQGAVYFHSGQEYLIRSLDWEQGLALAENQDLDYYTVAATITKVERLEVRRQVPAEHEQGEISNLVGSTDVTLTDERVVVYRKPAGYRRVHMATHETLGWGEIDLPEQVMETEAFRLTLGTEIVEALAEEGILVEPLDYGSEWPGIRSQILARDGNRCRLCGASGQPPQRALEVHHLTPLRVFLGQYPRPLALRLAHAPDNLLTLCPICHHQVERARGARTALSGLAYLLRNLVPIYLLCDPSDVGTAVQSRDSESGQPAIVIYDMAPGGVGLTSQLVDLWPRLVRAAFERVNDCTCASGCPSCIGPAIEVGAKRATYHLLERLCS